MKLEFLPEAREELDHAVGHYTEIDPAVGERFLDSVERVLRRIGTFPDSFPLCLGDVSKAVLPNFPYVVFYRVSGTTAQIVAVAHSRRRPGYWADRT